MEDNEWPLEKDRQFESEFFTEEELTEKQQENSWLRRGGPDLRPEEWYPTYDYIYYECVTLEELKKAFLYGNWAIRQGFTYKSLAFINQVNAGDEWWTLKKFEDGRLLHFESVTFVAIINDYSVEHFEEYIEQMLKATYKQCLHLDYLDVEFRKKWKR